MFCFCLQSSLLKLQALEVEGGASAGSSPEDSPPGLGSKEPRSPGGPPSDSSPPEVLSSQATHPPPPRSQQPPTPEAEQPTSTQHCGPPRSSGGATGGGEPQGGAGGAALLQLLAGGPSPLPSPRCSSPSLRFESDPDTAPSPPCSQQYMLCHGRGDRKEGLEDSCPPSVLFLTRQIQGLKKRVRRFEDQFELEMKYKPSYNDKYSDPEMVRVMNELGKARKQLKELRLRQSVFESQEHQSDGCRDGSGQQGALEHSPEETVESLLRRLKEKRRALGLPDNMKEMTQAQMVLEKITLQKCLLYFESLHGRPGTKQERNLVKPLYDRYQMIKHLLCASPTFNTIEEEEGSDEDCLTSMMADILPVPAARSAACPALCEEDGEPTFVSPIDEVKAVRQQGALTTENLHEASRPQLLSSLRETRAEKKRTRKLLREFEDEFLRHTGRVCQKEDRSPMKEEYQEYKQLKAKLRLLEVLLSKQDARQPV